jgi:CP family cyanate transporter-like MFS transporter
VLLLALLALTAGMALRSLPGTVALWVGTLGIGASVAVGNVLLPAVVKRDFPGRVTAATGAYSASMGAVAAVASGAAVPLSGALGGWRPALLVWAVLPLVVAALWAVRPPSSAPVPDVLPQAPNPTLLRSAAAWQLTVFFALQSACFYTLITWLPTVDRTLGTDARQAGAHLMIFQVVGMVSGVLVSLVMQGRIDQRLPAFAVGVPVLVAMVGLLAVPQVSAVWMVVAGLGSGSSLTVSLALVTLRTTTSDETAALSGMAQSLGYLISAAGPPAAGMLFDRSPSGAPVLALVSALAAVQMTVSLWAGRSAPIGAIVDGARRSPPAEDP